MLQVFCIRYKKSSHTEIPVSSVPIAPIFSILPIPLTGSTSCISQRLNALFVSKGTYLGTYLSIKLVSPSISETIVLFTDPSICLLLGNIECS